MVVEVGSDFKDNFFSSSKILIELIPSGQFAGLICGYKPGSSHFLAN